MLMKLGNYEDLRKHLAQTWQKIQETRNAYQQKYAEEALRYGAIDAENRMKAKQYDEEMFAKAHAAKLQGKQMGMRNFMDYLNHLSADNSQLKQFNAMWDLYNQEQINNKDAIAAQVAAANAQRDYYLNQAKQERETQSSPGQYAFLGRYTNPWFGALAPDYMNPNADIWKKLMPLKEPIRYERKN